ncbi:MAG: hypothetical protein LBH43_13855, partial [Treponema sp.]|nr:hypothetical protein [Treponema sp.]
TIKAALLKVFSFVADKAKEIWGKIVDIASGIVEKVKAVWSAFTGFFSGLFGKIKDKFTENATRQKELMLSTVEFSKQVWGGIKDIAGKALNGIKDAAGQTMENMKHGWALFKETSSNVISYVTGFLQNKFPATFDFVSRAVEKFHNFFDFIFNGLGKIVSIFTDIFRGDFQSAFDTAKGIIDGLKNKFAAVFDFITQNIFGGFINFFKGLWEAFKQGPSEALDYIKSAFFALFDSIKEKFFGFIGVIQNGLEKVKGFLGGVKDKVVSFVTGEQKDDPNKPKPNPAWPEPSGVAGSPRPVNDLIVTPKGDYSTNPSDYIMAMQEPTSLFDSLVKFFGGTQLQPAFAGAPVGSLMGNAMNKAATNNNYSTTSHTSETKVNAPISVNVNATGMTPEMASSMVKRGVEAALSDVISGARGTIPSPEARRD